MPQRCRGMVCPGGGLPRPCIFAADGRGQPSKIDQLRDGPGCVFCCPRAFRRAHASRVGTGNITRRLRRWRESGNPTYEAAFTFGILGLCLPPGVQRKYRRRAGERPKFKKTRSWLHKKKGRLETLRRGKPIPAAPQLCPEGFRFLAQCCSTFDRRFGKVWLAWVEELRFYVRKYDKYRRAEPTSTLWRRKWWQVRRLLRQRLQAVAVKGPPFPAAVIWAAAEGLVTLNL